MENSDTVITLIGERLAKVGNEFMFRGGAKECGGCKLKKTCLNLNEGIKYRITGVRNTGKHDCFVHDSGVCAVEVIEAPLELSVESRKAIKGSTIVFEPLSCRVSSCEHYELCHPSGLNKGDKLVIIDVQNEIIEPCSKEFILKAVEIKR
ncbi:MAG: UPF0179 family protein [Candidatus Methanoperedens sp.]|jgi:hypothetical protein|nr:UPF0179 family protein [Candidatus Methanoperedens sp.]PKL54619.1 MAG: hypothetical protein CVV36_01030 [Candidatus Methanoperedenaceae archaeon HGW-Methanoperedenaceae-1]